MLFTFKCNGFKDSRVTWQCCEFILIINCLFMVSMVASIIPHGVFAMSLQVALYLFILTSVTQVSMKAAIKDCQ